MNPHSEDLDNAAAKAAIVELSKVIPQHGPPIHLVVVGGMAMIWHGLRQASQDIDVALGLDRALVEASYQVQERLGLPQGWLNASAAGYAPHIDIDECESVLHAGRITVFVPPVRVLFAMKVSPTSPPRVVDVEDAGSLWPRCHFVDEADARVYVQKRYPTTPLGEATIAAIHDAARSRRIEPPNLEPPNLGL